MNELARRLVDSARRHGSHPAVDDGRACLDYAALRRAADEVAAALSRCALASDEPVPVAVSNQAHDVAALLGIWQAGGVAVPVHRTTPAPGASALLNRVGARLTVNLRPDLPAPAVLRDGPVAGPRGPAPPRRALLAGAALVVFTSGSSGEPKGVVLSAARMGGKLDQIASELAIAEGERTLLSLQLTFSFGQWVMATTLLAGGTLCLRERFDPAAFVADVETKAIDRAPAVPTMLRGLAPLAEAGRGRAWRGTVVAGGEVLPAALGRRLTAAWPRAQLADAYGLTETGTCDFFVLPGEYARAAGSIGRAAPGIDARIATGGELQIRSPYAMLGYLDDPALTDAAFVDGHFRTGDLARERADGRIELIGRAKEIVVRAGNKIAPLEVERVFLEHPAVEAALATGLPDARTGESLHLMVVPRQGQVLDPARLRDWAAERLERWKLPDRIHLGDSLPLGRTGKLDRRGLARLICC